MRNMNWMQALDAFEREYNIPNHYGASQGQNWAQRVFNHGLIENAYPRERVAEVLAFANGYSGNFIEFPPLTILAKATYSREIRGQMKKVFDAYRRGLQARKADKQKNLESRVKIG